MRKIITIILILVLAVSMTIALAACTPEQIVMPDDKNPDNIPTVNDDVELPEPMTALKEIIASFGNDGGNASFNISLPTRLNGKSYSVKMLGNIPTSDDDELELLVQISDTDKVLFGFYIYNGKFFIEVFDEYKNNSVQIHIQDIDADYLMSLLSKLNISVITDAIDGLLGGLGFTLDTIIEMVVPMLFTTESYKTAPGATDIVLRFSISDILSLASGFIPQLDGLIGDSLNADGLGAFLAEIVNSIPTFHIDVHSLIKNGKSSVFDVSLVTEEEVFGISADVTFNKEKIDIGLPADIASYEPFSILNLAFNLSLGVHTNGLDMGKLINTFMPNTLPENLLVFTSDRELTLKVNLSLDPKDNNKNLILLELYNGTDTTIDANRMLGAYFIDGTLKVNVTDISNAVNIPNIEIKGLNISALIDNVVNLLTSTIDGALDSLFPSADAPETELTDTSMIVPTTVGYDGEAIISPDVTSFIQALTKVFRMSDFVKLEENALTIDVNADFFTALETLVPSLSGTMDTFKNIGSLSLAVNLAPWGIDNIDLTYKPFNNDDNIFNINMNSFLIGFKTPELEKAIRQRTSNKEYSSNIEGILKGALDGIELEGNIELGVKKGNYNLASLLSGFVSLPSLNIVVPEDVVLDIGLKLQLSYDIDAPSDPNKTQGLLEIYLNKDISIFKQGKLLGLYIMGNDLYLDINGIGDLNIPKIKVKTDFMTLLHDEIIKLKYDLNFEGVLEGLIPSPTTENGDTTPASVASVLNAVSGGTAMDSILNIIDLNINETTLNIAVTSMALQKLLAKFGTDIELPPFDLTASITDIDDFMIKINALGFVSLKLQVTHANVGRDVTVELPAINPDDYSGDLQTLINNLLKGVDLQAQFKVKVNKGLDLRELFKLIPIPLDLNLEFTEDVTLGLDLKLQMTYDANDSSKNKFLLEIGLTDDVLFLNKGRLLTVYGARDALYVNFAEINGIQIPKMKFNIDIMSKLNDILDTIDLDFIINAGGGDTEPVPTPTAATVNDSVARAPEFDSDTIFLKQNYIQLYITSELVLELLKEFGVILDFELPDFDISIDIGDGSDNLGFTGIFIKATMDSVLEAELSVTEFAAGQYINIETDNLNDDYLDSLSNIAAEILKGVELEVGLNVTLHAGEHNLSSILQLFGDIALPDVVISIPNQLEIGAKLNIKLAYDQNNPKNSKILIELYILNDILKVIKGSDTVPFISIYGINKTLYIEANNTVGFSIPKVSTEVDIFGMLMDEIDKIDIQELIYGLVNGGSGEGESDAPATVADNDSINVAINNDSLKLYTTMTAILNLIKTLSPGTNIDIPNFDLSLEINGLDDIKINADKMFNAMTLALNFGIRHIGTPVNIPSKNINADDYNGSLVSLAEDILDGVSIEANLKLTLYKGIYDVSDLLKDLIALPPIVLDIKEETVLDITLKLQIKYVVNKNNGNESNVTGASELVFELYLNNDVAFAKAGKLLGVYGKDGSLYCEIANIMGVSVPKIRVDIDVFDMLNKIIKEQDIDFILKSNDANIKLNNADAPATVADTDDTSDSITAIINQDSLKLMITANAFAELLKMLGLNIELPPIDLTAEITGLENITITAGVGSYLTASLSFKNVILGDENLKIDMPAFEPGDYVNDLQSVAREALAGIDIEAKVSMSFLPGEHDISSVLALFGIVAPPILFTVPGTEIVNIDLRLVVQFKMTNADEQGTARIELWVENDALIFNAGKLLLGAYVTDGKLYLEISPDGAIDGINGVRVALGLDLMQEIEKIVSTISQNFVIDTDGILNPNGGSDENGGSEQKIAGVAGISTVADKAGSGSIGITVNQESLQIAVTASAIQQLLLQFGIDITLPEFNVTASIDSIDGIKIGANLMGMIGLDIALTKTVIGNKDVVVELPEINPEDYASDLNAVLDSILIGTRIEGNIKLTLTEDFNINELINTLGIPFDMPPISIAIPKEGVTIDARILMELKFDPSNPENSKALVEIWLNEAPILFDRDTFKDKPFIGAYYENGNIYAEINNISGVTVPKIMLRYDFMSELKTIIDNLNVDFSKITIGGAEENGGGSNSGEKSIPALTASSSVAVGDDAINIEIKQDTLVLGVTLNAIKQLLKVFDINLELPEIDLSVDVSVKTLQDIKLSVGAGVNGKTMLKLDLNVTALSFADENLVVDLSDKIVRDENGNIISDAYNTNLQDLLKDALAGVELEAGLKLQIHKGFNLGELLNGLGVSLPNLDITFPTDVLLDAALKIQLKYDANKVENTVGKIELYVNESVLFINKGLLLSVYIQGNTFYIQVGEQANPEEPDKILGGIAGVKVPIIKIQTDILTFLSEKIATIDVNFLLDAQKEEEGKEPNTDPAPTAATGTFGENDLNVEINKDALILSATNIAIQQLLDEFGLNLGFVLPDFSIYGELKGLDDIKLTLNHNEFLIADLAFNNLNFGDASFAIEGIPDFSTVSFSDNIAGIVDEVLKGVDIEADLKLVLKGNERFNLADIINSFGLSLPDIFITIDDNGDPSDGFGDILLDATLKLQLSIDQNTMANTRGLIEIWLNKDVAIAKASTEKPLLGLYLIGDNIYLEINNLENVTVPKIKLKADIGRVIAGLLEESKEKIAIKVMPNVTPDNKPAETGYSAVNDSVIADNNISVSVNQDSIKLVATAEALTAFLASVGVAISWPDIDINAEIKNVDGVTIELNVGADIFGFANFDLSLKKINAGNPVSIDMSHINDADYNSTLTSIVENLLKGIDISGNVNLTLPKGTYDFTAFLAQFGVSIPTIAYNLTQDMPLKSRFVFKTAYDSANPSNSKAMIEWIITNPEEVFFLDTKNYTDQSEVIMLGLYLENDIIYLDLSNIVIANIRLPKVKLNTNILSMLTDLVDLIKLDLDLNELFGIKSENGGSGNGGASKVADTIDNGTNDATIGISSQALHLKVTAVAIQLLLSSFGVNVELPDFDVSAEVSELNGINLSFSMGFTDNTISLDIKEVRAKFGEVPEIIIPEEVAKDPAYSDTIKDIIMNLISDIDISGQVNINSAKSTLNITSIVNAILATTGQYFDLPININMDDFSNVLHFDVKWHLEKNDPRKSEASIVLFSEKGDLTVSIYLQNGTLYVDLSGLGLMQFKISNFNFTGLLNRLIDEILPKISPELVKDLSALLDGVLAGLKPVSDGKTLVTPEDMARNAQSYNKMQALINEAAEGDEVLDIITIILSSLDITDTLIKLDFKKAFIDELISKAGVYLGLDLYGGANLDIKKGTLDGKAVINELELGFTFNVNTFGNYGSMIGKVEYYDFLKPVDTGEFFEKVNEVPNVNNYTEYKLINALDILQSVLGGKNKTTQEGNMVPLAYIDMYNSAPEALAMKSYYDDPNRYGGYGDGATTRIFIQRVTSYDSFAGGMGSLKIGIFKDYEMSVNPLNIGLDIASGNLKVLGTTDLFNKIVNGSLLNLSIPMDLAGILAPLIDPIFKDLSDDMFIKDTANDTLAPVPTADITVGGEEGTAAFNITDYVKSIDLNMFETGVTKLDIGLNGKTISDMLVTLLDDLFMNLDISGSGSPARIPYKDKALAGSGFYDVLWNDLIKPLVRSELEKSMSGILAGMIESVMGIAKNDIGNTVKRLLPLPIFTEMSASITFADSKFKSVEVATNGTRNNEQLRLNIYPAGQTEVIDWGYIPGSVVYDPYSQEKILPQFEGKYATRNDSDGGAHWKNGDIANNNTAKASLITYSGADYDKLKAMDSSGNYEPGIYKFNAVSTFYRADANKDNRVTESFNKEITITILEKGKIEKIEDVFVQSYGDVPNQVVAQILKNDGTVESRLIKGVKINSTREGYVTREHETTVNLGGIYYGVKVVYLDSTIARYDGEFNVDAYSKDSLVSKLPSRIFFQYGSGYFSSREVVWDTSAMNGLSVDDWVTGGKTYDIYATIPDGSKTPQVLTYKVNLRTTRIETVQFKGENTNNTVTVDPYLAIQEREAAVLAEESSVFPTSATIVYADGRKETMPISWSGMENYPYNPAGGTTTATITNTIGDYKWKHEVNVNVLSRTIKYVSFGKDEDGKDIKELDVNPYDYLHDNGILPNTVMAIFEEGEPVEVPCKWSIPTGAINPNGGYVQVTLTIMPGTAMQTAYKPILNVKRMNIVDIVLPKDEDGKPQYTLTDSVSVLYGEKSVNDIKPNKLKFLLDTGEVVDINVYAIFDTISITADGGTYKDVKFTLPDGKEYLIDVVIPLLIASGTPDKTITIKEADFIEFGSAIFPTKWNVEFNGTVHKVNVKWVLDNVTYNGGTAMIIIGDGLRPDLRIPIEVIVEKEAESQQPAA